MLLEGKWRFQKCA